MTDVKVDMESGVDDAPASCERLSDEESKRRCKEMCERIRREENEYFAEKEARRLAKQRGELVGAEYKTDDMTYRRARNLIVRNEGLRRISEARWVDPETEKICKEMRDEMAEARDPSAQYMGVFFYLREPMLKDQTYLIGVWDRHRKHPILFERYESAAAALHAMQQSFRAERCRAYAGDWSDMYGEG